MTYVKSVLSDDGFVLKTMEALHIPINEKNIRDFKKGLGIGVEKTTTAVDAAGTPAEKREAAREAALKNVTRLLGDKQHTCANTECGMTAANVTKFCTRCKAVYYCGKDCQLAHWRAGHKDVCVAVVSSTDSDSRT